MFSVRMRRMSEEVNKHKGVTQKGGIDSMLGIKRSLRLPNPCSKINIKKKGFFLKSSPAMSSMPFLPALKFSRLQILTLKSAYQHWNPSSLIY